MTRLRVFALLTLFAAVPVFAATTDLTVLMDTDRDATTGCTIAGMAGVEQVLVTRVTSDATTAAVTRTFRQVCTAGTLGPEIDVETTGWPVGFQTASGRMVIETRVPFSVFGAEVPRMHLGVMAAQGALTHVATGLPDGSAVYYPEMPRGRRRAASAPGTVRMITLDGADGDWSGLGPIFNGIASGGTNGLRIVKINAFANSTDDFLYFLFDINVSTDAPIAVDDEYERPSGAGLTVPPPGVLDNDQDPNGLPLTAMPVSPAAHGNVTLNPDGGFTYTPNDPASTQTDAFEYKASNGAKESSAARVTISVQGGAGDNQAPVFTSPATRSVPEGSTSVGSVVAIDADGDTVTYSISGGADASKFSLTGGNNLVFNSAPDFEAPLSAGGSNSYVVEVTADDGNGGTSTQTITVNVTNVDEAPSFTSSNSFTVAEGTTSVGTATASDPDDTSITYSLGGTDASRFTINATTGALSFTSAPDFENPTDAGANNVYSIQITATDGTGSAVVQNVNVTVTDVNEAPVFTSTAAPNVPENTTAVVTVTVDDPEGNAITYSISGGADAADFSINATTGALTFNVAPNFEAPHDADANNFYLVQVTATDGTNPVTQSLVVTVTNVNEPPTITSANSASVPENTTAILTVTTTDPENNTMTYSITGGADQALFAINASSGALSFVSGRNFEAPADADANNTYVVTVTANDGANNVAQTITVTVTNVNEAPVFTSTAAPSAPENTTAVLTVTTTDPEAQAVTYSLTGGADQARFSINASTGALTFNVAPNFEAPTDSDTNNTYVVQVTATDGTNPVNQTITVTVTNVNEAPVITSANSATIPENIFPVLTVTTTDEENDTISYSITGGADAARFTVDPDGSLLFAVPPNFEAPADADANNQYIVQVTVTDGTTPVNQTITVTVTDVNEFPVVTSGYAFTVVENNTAAGTITATDEEGDTITYSLVAGAGDADNALFSVNATTGALTFNVAPDFEAPADADANNVYQVRVRISDGVNNDDLAFTVTVTNTNEAPLANDATFLIDENSANGTGVGTVSASDQDSGQTLTYSITAGNALGAFAINSTTGAITVADVTDLNFEVNPTFSLTVTVTDDGAGNLNDTATITINLNNLNEAPVVDAATVAIDENSANATAVHTVTFTEPDTTGQTHTFAITAGNGSGAFAINPTTGAITVADTAQLNYEATTQFVLTVQVTDAGAPAPALSGTANITININDINEAPVITSGNTANVAENTTAVTTVTATDEEGNTLTYSITGGADSGSFSINSASGALSFLSAPNFENPTDADTNNVYIVEVTVTDGTTPVAQTISVTVTNVNEAPVYTAGTGTSNVPENTTAVTDLDTTDPESDTVTFSITGGADAAFFSVNSSSGVVTFNAPQNFEAPADANADNQYVVEVTATDGTTPVATTLLVNVTNVDEAPAFTSSATPSVVEGNTAVLTVTTTDPEGQTVTYSITGGADMALFSINSGSGALTFNSAPDFEAPADAGANNVYDVIVTATDGTNNPTQAIAVTVTNANEAPAFTSTATPSVAENNTAVVTVTTTDPESDTITYSISGGVDAADFSINSSSGALTFNVPPNFEVPADADANNVYIVEVTANDGTNAPTQTITVTVTAVDEAPTFTSSDTISVAENTLIPVIVQAIDQEGQTITYSITGGADAADFFIHASNGDLQFNVAPNFEAPHDADTNNVYLVQVTATDGSNPVVQNISITITNTNEAPSITSGNFTVAENVTAVGTVTATDPDGDTPTYAIVGSTDSSYFAIDSNTGALSFLAPPNFESPQDSGANNIYDIVVRASDGGALFSDQAITITVTNVNEAPVFTSLAAQNVPENTTAVLDVDAVDPEGAGVTYSITGGADMAKFTINGASGVLDFLVAPDFEAPTDADTNNTYIVQVTATDGSNPGVQTITVTVTDANDPPVFTSTATPSVAENNTTAVDVDATDPEAGTVTYSITGGADAADFSINSSSGLLTFNVSPNFEAPHDADTNNVYLVQVTATDGTNPAVQNLTITVTDVNEAPSITSTNSATVAENSVTVLTVTTTDPEGNTITYSITGGADQGAFAINSSSGELTFVAPPNFEIPADADANNVYIVQVTATDGTNPVNQTITVTVTDVNEGPAFTSSATPSVAENNTTAVDVDATDPEGVSVTYSITGGADAGDFSINASSGLLTFNVSPNFEAPHDADTNNTYLVEVTATDGSVPAMQAITVTVTDVNEAPSFTSSSTPSVPENTTTAVDVDATDPDATTPTYSITGGADAADFSIDTNTGVLTFLVAPNFEAPHDADTNNIYLVDVTATDGTNNVVQNITVTVTNVDEAPVFSTGNAFSVDENQTAVVDVDATDPEGAGVTYSITGGADQGDFSIVPATGVLTFNPAPNFEAPADADTNNTYIVQVTATDGTNPVNLTITVTVTNVNEAPVNTFPAATQTTPEDTNLVFPGTISVSDPDGNVTVQMTLTASKGTLTIPVITGLTFTTGDGTDDATLVFSGTTSTINTRLNGLIFKPTPNYYSNDLADADGPGSLTILTNDLGNSGSGGALSSNGGTPDSVTIEITAVNDKPTTASYTVANGNAHITHSGIGITIAASDSNELKEDAADVDNHDPYSELTVQIVGGTLSPANATLTLIDAGTGAFYFEPPGGLSGSAAASFQYQVCDNGHPGLGLAAQCSDPATVQFTITGTDTWFVDDADAAGCGVSCNGARTKPLVGLNNATLVTRGTGDRIFAFSGTYNHGFTMAANETLIGQASTGSFDTLFAVSVPSNGTIDTRPTLSGAAVTLQNTLTAANNTLLRGFSIASGANKGYVASGATTLTVMESQVNSTGNMAIDVTGATNAATSVTFSSTNSGGGTRGVSLDGVNGTWSLGSGSLSANTQAAFYLQNSNSSNISYSGNLAPSGAARAVLIGTPSGGSATNASNGLEAGTTVTLSGNITAGGIAAYESSGGTLHLTGTTHTWNTGTNRGVDLIDNNGATFNFSSGALNITTSTGTGFHASEGGTVNVTGANNILNTTSGTALEVTGTSGELMAGGLTFKTISADADGPANSVTTTYGATVRFFTGGFTIQGDGTASLTAGGTISGANYRGLELQNVSGAISVQNMTYTNSSKSQTVTGTACGLGLNTTNNTSCAAAIHLETTPGGVTLNRISINGSAQAGINGYTVTNLNMSNIEVQNAGNDVGENGILLKNLLGTGTATSLNLHNNAAKQLHIINTANNDLTSYTINNSTFANTVGPNGGQGVLLETYDSGTSMNVSIDNGTFSSLFSNAHQVATNTGSTQTVSVTNSTFTNVNSWTVIQASDGGTNNFTVSDNDGTAGALSGSHAIVIKTDNADLAGTASNATGTISNNLVGSTGVGSGAACGGGCSGIAVAQRDGGTLTVDIKGNTIRHVDARGIDLTGGNSYAGNAGKLVATITGNLIKDPDNTVGTLSAIHVQAGTQSGDTNCLQATIGGTVVPGAWPSTANDTQNRIEGNWDLTTAPTFSAGNEIFIWRRFTSTLAIPGYTGTAFVAGRNSITSADGTSVGASGTITNGTCP